MDFSVSDVNKILGNIKNGEGLTNQFQTFKNISLDSRTILNHELLVLLMLLYNRVYVQIDVELAWLT